MTNQNNNTGATLMFIGGSLVGLVICFFLWKTVFKSHGENGKEHGDIVSAETGEQLFRISGSNTIGNKLMPELAKEFMEHEGYHSVSIQNQAEGEVWVTGKKDGHDGAKYIAIHSQGSENAFTDIAEDKADVGMSSRAINDSERKKLSAKGDMRTHLNEHILGLDGLAIIVSGNNPVRSLSKSQLQGIFSGTINNWSQVSKEKAGLITLYGRDNQSGTYEFFKTKVMNGNSFASTITSFSKNEELSKAVSGDANGIGYVSLSNVGNNKSLAISEDEKLTPLHANAFTIATEDYPLSRRLYLYKNPTTQSHAVSDFIHFALSDEGEKAVEKAGFVSTALKTTDAATIAVFTGETNTPAEYKAATTGASRENFNIHFLTGSAILDNKALDDIERLAEHWNNPEYKNKQIILLGFTDDQGAHATNQKLGQTRAIAVAAELKGHGISGAKSIGLGEIMPVSTNLTPEGREKNRRVEVWIQ